MAKRREELDAVLRQARRWPPEDQFTLIKGLLTPEMRLRLVAEQVRRQGQPRNERRIDVIVNRAVRKVRGAHAPSR